MISSPNCLFYSLLSNDIKLFEVIFKISAWAEKTLSQNVGDKIIGKNKTFGHPMISRLKVLNRLIWPRVTLTPPVWVGLNYIEEYANEENNIKAIWISINYIRTHTHAHTRTHTHTYTYTPTHTYIHMHTYI